MILFRQRLIFVKIHVVNNPDASGKGGGFTCTGIVEAELYLANQADILATTQQQNLRV